MTSKSACCVTKQFERFPKDVIIKAFMGGVGFFHSSEILKECERIHEDQQFQMLMARGEELSRQMKALLADKPQGDLMRCTEWVVKIDKINKEQDKLQKKIDKLLELS